MVLQSLHCKDFKIKDITYEFKFFIDEPPNIWYNSRSAGLVSISHDRM